VCSPTTLADVQAIYNYEKIPDGARERAFEEVVPTALKRNRERVIARAIKDATHYALENCGAKPGENLTTEQMRKVAALAAERMIHARRQRA
jgi:hypothetical protein